MTNVITSMLWCTLGEWWKQLVVTDSSRSFLTSHQLYRWKCFMSDSLRILFSAQNHLLIGILCVSSKQKYFQRTSHLVGCPTTVVCIQICIVLETNKNKKHVDMLHLLHLPKGFICNIWLVLPFCAIGETMLRYNTFPMKFQSFLV